MLRRIAILGVILTGSTWPAAVAQVPTKVVPTPPVPGKSLPAVQGAGRMGRSYPARGIEAVVLRAEGAEQAKVRTIPGRGVITVTGRTAGDARGYHAADPNWKETPAALWGLDFAAKSYGPTLVISSVSEIRYIHHDYHIEDIEIEVPPGIAVIKEKRELKGESPPDLSEPGRKKG